MFDLDKVFEKNMDRIYPNANHNELVSFLVGQCIIDEHDKENLWTRVCEKLSKTPQYLSIKEDFYNEVNTCRCGCHKRRK